MSRRIESWIIFILNAAMFVIGVVVAVVLLAHGDSLWPTALFVILNAGAAALTWFGDLRRRPEVGA